MACNRVPRFLCGFRDASQLFIAWFTGATMFVLIKSCALTRIHAIHAFANVSEWFERTSQVDKFTSTDFQTSNLYSYNIQLIENNKI